MTFSEPYQRSTFLNFLQNRFLTDNFNITEERIEPEFKPTYVKNITLLGRDAELELSVFEFNHASENDPRVGLSKDTFRLMANLGIQRALAIFKSSNSKNFRFSLITVELALKGAKVKREYSNPRRYSYFLGPDAKLHTPLQFLIAKGRVDTFYDLQSRFSVEVVNKEFYKEIAIKFTALTGGIRKVGSRIEDFRRKLSLPSVNEPEIFQEFTVRLIGRLVFCWFLKMKKSEANIPLVPEEVLSLEAAKNTSGYYHEVLEKLFFEILNTDIDDRKDKFQREPYSLIPFLNGGLFTPHQHDYFETYKTGTSKHLNTLKVPDTWLREFIEILETYNFTVDENTSVDIDLSVDPEMLGRIFENLLAEINPETGKSARKSTGSYYTPRSIVEFMVDESLKQYLINKTKISEAIISDLLSYAHEELNLSIPMKEMIIDAFDKVKILDPACGSGAFPMGVLQKMLLVLQRVDPDSKLWLDRQLKKIEVSSLRRELKRKLAKENVDYIHKLGIIQNSIYGVDIQPIATEISKLRCFLSLIVDEKVDDQKSNRGILALPNLEFKFVAANTLICLPDKEEQSEMFNVDEDISSLSDLRKKYFASSGAEKNTVVADFTKAQNLLAQNYFNKSAKDDRAIQLSNWNPFGDDSTDWFDPEWMFGITNGFEIIIANPPYLGHKSGQKKIFRDIKSTKLGKRFNNERMDIFYYFFHISLDYLNNDGILSFITTNYYLTADSAIKLRRDFYNRTNIVRLVNFNELKIFESALGQHNILTFLTKQNIIPNTQIINVNSTGHASNNNLNDILSGKSSETLYHDISKENLFDSEQYYMRLNYSTPSNMNTVNEIINKIKSDNKLLSEYCNISQGIVTGIDKVAKKHFVKFPEVEKYYGSGVFVISNAEKRIIGSSKLLKPWFKNSDISRYGVNENCNNWLIHTSTEVKLSDFPNIKKHLNKYKKLVLARNYESGELSKAKRQNKWWALSSSRWEFDFETPKIVCPQRSYSNTFAYTEKPWYASADVYFIIAKENISLKYILGVLNSKLIYFWLYNRGKRKGEMLELYLTPLSEIPIRIIENQELIINLVNTIITKKKENVNNLTIDFENQIDIMVYRIYELTYNEIKIIDPEIENIISKKDYEKFEIK